MTDQTMLGARLSLRTVFTSISFARIRCRSVSISANRITISAICYDMRVWSEVWSMSLSRMSLVYSSRSLLTLFSRSISVLRVRFWILCELP